MTEENAPSMSSGKTQTEKLPRKLSSFIETSADDYLVGPKGSLDFFKICHEKFLPAGEDCGYQEFINSVDAVIMGKLTFEVVSGMDRWWYGMKPVYVLCHGEISIPETLKDKAMHRLSSTSACK